MGNGLWEVRTGLPSRRTARVLLCVHEKKTRRTPEEDLELAMKRQRELQK
jgi:phage-related protein